VIRIISDLTRAELHRAIDEAPAGWRVIIEEPKRTSAQNRLMWALLKKVADQVVHFGRKYEAETWKCIFMKALGAKLEFAPSLDGKSVVAIGYSSSGLGKAKMSDLIELIYSEGAERAVDFDREKAA
jgi:hypothetical protein